MSEELTAEEQAELEELDRLVKLRQKAEEIELRKQEAAEEERAKAQAEAEAAYAAQEREKTAAMWVEPNWPPTEKCPFCQAPLKKKPDKGNYNKEHLLFSSPAKCKKSTDKNEDKGQNADIATHLAQIVRRSVAADVIPVKPRAKIQNQIF